MNAPIDKSKFAPIPGPAKMSVNAHLKFKRHGSKTYLADQHTPHPFHITRPFMIEGDPNGMATLYLQSSSGGLYHDDDQALKIEVAQGAHAYVTSQASTVVHNSHRGISKYSVDLDVGENGWLEYCPEPNILFPGAKSENKINAVIDLDSRLILTDSQLLHDPSGQGIFFQSLENEIIIRHADHKPFYIERSVVRGENWFGATDGKLSAGTFIVYDKNATDNISDALETCISKFDPKRIYAGLSVLKDRSITSVRMIAASGADLSHSMTKLWEVARFAMTGQIPKPRRK